MSSRGMIHDVETVNLPQAQNNQNVPNAHSAVIINVIQTNPPQPQSHTEGSIRHEQTRADHEIYFHQLLTKKRGIPLYIPSPGMQLPREYRKLGVSIGDVGILHEFGAFDFLFNIFLLADHPINNNLVPPKFYPLDDRRLRHDIQRDKTYGPNGYLTSSSVYNTSNSSNGLVFETSTREGAILTMPDGALTQDLLNRQSLNRYIEENLGHWYNYAIDTRGRIIENGDIRVVTGCDKVTRWGIATITSNIEQTLSLTFKGGGDGTSFHWVCVGGGSGRVGPEIQDEDVAGASLPQNQCVFVRTTNAKLSAELWNNLMTSQEVWSGADTFLDSSSSGYFSQEGPNEQPGSDGSPDAGHSYLGERRLPTQRHVSFSTVKSEAFHPSTYLNNFLLNKYPKAKMVITEDADWTSALCDEDTIFPKSEDLCARVFALGDMQESNGILTLQPKNNVGTGKTITIGKELNDWSAPIPVVAASLAEEEEEEEEEERLKSRLKKGANRQQERERALESRELKIQKREYEIIEKERQLRQKEEELNAKEQELIRLGNEQLDQSLKAVARVIDTSVIRKGDKIIILVGSLASQKDNFIDCLTQCENRYRRSPSTFAQLFDGGDKRIWVKAVRFNRGPGVNPVVFVDFPGLDDDSTAERALEDIGQWLKTVHQQKFKLTRLLYFHPLTEDASNRNFRSLEYICGPDAAKKIIFVTTFWDQLPALEAENAQCQLQSSILQPMLKLGAGIEPFYNTTETGWRIIDGLLWLDSEPDVAFRLQTELVGSTPVLDTSAGKFISEQLGRTRM